MIFRLSPYGYVASPILIAALIVAGFFVGNLINFLIGFLEWENSKKGIPRTFPGLAELKGDTSNSWYTMIVGWFYFACLFSVPLSGNIPLFIMTAGMFLYALYGSFGREKLKPSKQEDKVDTKWFSGFP